MGNLVVAQGTLRERDYVRAQYLNVKPGRVFASIGVVLILAYFWATYMEPSWAGFLIPLTMVILFAVVIPWRAKRSFRQYKALSEPVSMEVREDGLFFKRQHGEGVVPWDHIVKWRRNKALVLLYPTSNVFYIVPGHFFPSEGDFEAFKKLIQERIGHAA
jgi:hypothetical protein